MLWASSPIREAHCMYSFCASGLTCERNTVITIATPLSCSFLELLARLFYPHCADSELQPPAFTGANRYPYRLRSAQCAALPSVPGEFYVVRLEILPVQNQLRAVQSGVPVVRRVDLCPCVVREQIDIALIVVTQDFAVLPEMDKRQRERFGVPFVVFV